MLLSVVVITYNHGRWIRQCLDGIIMQQTDFPVEIIVHDDASTDGTADIIRQYAAEHPDTIVPLLRTENQYNRHRNFNRILSDCFDRCRGEYIAICEGDDYWTDPRKLQRQVDFLRNHHDFSLCFHNATVFSPSEEPKPFARLENREYSARELISRWISPTASFLFRASVVRSDLYRRVVDSKKLLVGDSPIMRTALAHGRVYGFADAMSAYRRLPGGALASLQAPEMVMPLIRQEREYARIFGGESRRNARRLILRALPYLLLHPRHLFD